MVTGGILLILGIFLEVLFRMQMGIKLNTVFCSMTNGMSSTSILHTHLIKSILGAVLTQIMGPFIQSDINTGVGLYAYVPSFAFLVILLIPVLFVAIVLASQKRLWPSNFLLAFFSSCLIIGIVDGGMFATPSYVGILGLYLIYRNGYYINYAVGTILKDDRLDEENRLNPPIYKFRGFSQKRFIFNRVAIYFVVILFIILRFTVAFAGAEPEYYTVDIVNPTGDIDLGNISIEVIDNAYENSTNKVTYHIDPQYNEMKLINDLRAPLDNSCEYYTVSWNIYSYLK